MCRRFRVATVRGSTGRVRRKLAGRSLQTLSNGAVTLYIFAPLEARAVVWNPTFIYRLSITYFRCRLLFVLFDRSGPAWNRDSDPNQAVFVLHPLYLLPPGSLTLASQILGLTGLLENCLLTERTCAKIRTSRVTIRSVWSLSLPLVE